MQQRRLRLGDIVDDYCPRERRITNHAIVAMIEDQVKQTRCTTCDADHEYKQARIPPQRRKKDAALPLSKETLSKETLSKETLSGELLAGAPRKHEPDEPQDMIEEIEPPTAPETDAPTGEQAAMAAPADDFGDAASIEDAEPRTEEDEGPVHRRLIRATLPRVEGQPPPERKGPDFTIHQRDINGNRAGRGPRRRAGHMRAQHGPGQTPRFGSQRPAGHQKPGQGPRHGSGQGPGQGPGGNRSGQGQPGQHRHNRHRKRGR